MHILIISDIHANLTALNSVLIDAGTCDATWCLGDLVGYGPDPNECIARVRELPNLSCIIGNHDAAAINEIDKDTFNIEARQALEWTQEVLSEDSRDFLRSLPELITFEQVTITHGSPRQPVWEYLMDNRAATTNFKYFSTPFCFVGHTHIPVIFHLKAEDQISSLDLPEPNQEYPLVPRTIINPGSVGQPRDRDPRAAYAIYSPEEHTWNYRRVAYDILDVQGRMRQARLPERHIIRLESGW